MVAQSIQDVHFRTDDPVQIFLAFLVSTRASLYTSEELRMPVKAVVVSLGCLFSLHVFDPCLFRRGCILILSLHSLGHQVPQLLRFTLVLLFQRSSLWIGRLCVGGVEEKLLFSRL